MKFTFLSTSIIIYNVLSIVFFILCIRWHAIPCFCVVWFYIACQLECINLYIARSSAVATSGLISLVSFRGKGRCQSVLFDLFTCSSEILTSCQCGDFLDFYVTSGWLRNYAKRQLTWFRGEDMFRHVDASAPRVSTGLPIP